MAEPADTIVEVRDEVMVSPTGAYQTLRKARFLKPTATSIDTPPSLSLFSKTPTSEPAKCPLKVTFRGWIHSRDSWKTWVENLQSKYQSLWKKVGIHEAIMGSTYQILKDSELVLALAEKWTPETNSFIFPWGEVTITLEDMIVLGGYNVLGSPVFNPVGNRELKEVEEKLIDTRKSFARTKAKKASQNAWMRHFMDNESELEHEAFLSLWLSRFVFPLTSISKRVFPIAIHLARGTKIALAPAVLASIYRDMTFLKGKIVDSFELENNTVNSDGSVINLSASFQLVQIWAWERFVNVRPPNPNSVEYGEPRSARWHKLEKVKLENVRVALDSAGECFQWLPYATNGDNWLSHKFYSGKEEKVSVHSDSDEVLESFARCLRACELVGMDCIEQYMPHRVAMQLGMDQDLPGHVCRCNSTFETAWNNYNRPISKAGVLLPSQLFDTGVTIRYLEWWRKSVLGQGNTLESDVQWKICSRVSKRSPDSFKGKNNTNVSVPPDFPLKWNSNDAGDSVEEDNLTWKKLGSCKGHTSVPPGFSAKCNSTDVGNFVDEDKLTLKELLESRNRHKSDHRPLSTTQSQISSSTTLDNESARNMESQSVEKVNQSVSFIEESGRPAEDAYESIAGSPVCVMKSVHDNEGESGGYSTLRIPVLELGARIDKLERVIAELKARRSGNRLGKKPSKVV